METMDEQLRRPDLIYIGKSKVVSVIQQPSAGFWNTATGRRDN